MNPIIWFLPAYVANASASLARHMKTHPIDMGLMFFDGRRILGDGKTWEGFFIGILAGGVMAILIGNPVEGLLMSVGAMVGDIIGSFIKRRGGLERGEEAPLLDQLDFVAGAFLFAKPDSYTATVILWTTPIIHRIANIIGHRLGVKREPW